MTRYIASMALLVRRELIAWAFLGLAFRWIWQHGFDRWSVAFILSAMVLHPRRD